MRKFLAIFFALLPLFLLANAEAERFFAEFQHYSEKNRPKAEKALKTALALDPLNEKIRYAELWFFSRKIVEPYDWQDNLWANRIKNYQLQKERVEKFRRDFPQRKRLERPWAQLFMWRLPGAQPISNATAEEMDKLDALCDYYRILLQEDLSERYQHDWSDDVQSIDQLRNIMEVYRRISLPQNYFDYTKWTTLQLTYATKLLQRFEDYLADNPDDFDKLNNLLGDNRSGGCNDGVCNIFLVNYPNYSEQNVKNYLNSTTEFIDLAHKSSFPYFRRQGIGLEFMRKSINDPNINATKVKEFLEEYWQKTEEISPGILSAPTNSINYSDYSICFKDFTVFLLKDGFIGKKQLEVYREKHGIRTDYSAVEKIIKDLDYQAVIDNSHLISSFNLNRLRENNAAYFFANLARGFFNDPDGYGNRQKKLANPLGKMAFEALNRDFEIQTITYQELFHYNQELFLIRSIEYKNVIYLLMRTRAVEGEYYLVEQNLNYPEFLLGIIDNSGKAKELIKTPIPAYYANIHCPLAVAVNDDNIVVIPDNGKIYRYDKAKESWTQFVNDIEIKCDESILFENRIFLLQAPNPRGGPSVRTKMLVSLKLDGSDRKIHFASERIDKLTPLDADEGWLCGLSVYGDRIYFLNPQTRDKTLLYAYDEKTDCFEEILLIHNFMVSMKRQDDLFLLQDRGGAFIYSLSPANGELQKIFSRFETKDIPSLGANSSKPVEDFVVQDSQLWIADDIFGGYIDLKSPKNSPFLLLPFGDNRGNKVYLGQDKSAIYFCDVRFFIVRVKE